LLDEQKRTGEQREGGDGTRNEAAGNGGIHGSLMNQSLVTAKSKSSRDSSAAFHSGPEAMEPWEAACAV
jgi:hypothetical protein